MQEVINRGEYLIKFDEASYSRSVKLAYTWLARGESSSIINSRFLKSANVIFALWVDEEWIWLLSNKTISGVAFVRFILFLAKSLDLVLRKDLIIAKVLLDNAPLHSSNIFARAVHRLRLPLHFLPPYSPCLAPVKWVFFLNAKKNHISGEIWSTIKFSIAKEGWL